VIAFLVAAIVISITAGHDEHAAPNIAGFYTSNSPCLGKSFKLVQSGQFVDVSGGVSGKLRLRHGKVSGTVHCAAGGSATVSLAVLAKGSKAKLAGPVGSEQATARFAEALPAPGSSAKPPPKRTSEQTFGRLMLAIAAVILAARLVGTLTARLSQPRVMGEVLAGILLGPTLLGAVWPDAKNYLFPPDIVPLLSGAAQIGLAFYLFLVGMELDPRVLRSRIGQAAFISNTSVAFPMGLGFLVALPIYKLLSPDVRYLPFALFMGVAMSITAFPVLARILIERRMLRRPVGAISMAGAAIDDVTAWGLLALATAVAGSGKATHAIQVILLAAIFTAAMLLIGRRLLGRLSKAYDEVGQVSSLWLGAIFVCVLLAAYTAQQIGVAAIFGAFIVGLIMPRRAGLTADVSRRFENFVVLVLLPLFFVVTGLKTQVNALNQSLEASVEAWNGARYELDVTRREPGLDTRSSLHCCSTPFGTFAFLPRCGSTAQNGGRFTRSRRCNRSRRSIASTRGAVSTTSACWRWRADVERQLELNRFARRFDALPPDVRQRISGAVRDLGRRLESFSHHRLFSFCQRPSDFWSVTSFFASVSPSTNPMTKNQ
jgi:Kef-type K+ transport system membrane component KefB